MINMKCSKRRRLDLTKIDPEAAAVVRTHIDVCAVD